MEVIYPEKGIIHPWTFEEGGHQKFLNSLITLYLLTNCVYRGWGWAKRALFAWPQLEDAFLLVNTA